MKKWLNLIKQFSVQMELLIAIYFFFMLLIYPLYLQDGYYMITDGKYHFYQCLHLSFFAVMALLFLIHFLCYLVKKIRKENTTELRSFQSDAADEMLGAFFFLLLSSSYLALNRHTAIYGFQDWYMGAFMFASFFLCYFLISHGFVFRKYCLHLIGIAVSVVCVIGYFQRFNRNLITDRGFLVGSNCLSTIGNINWICDYLSIVWMIVVYLFFHSNWIGKVGYGVSLFFGYGFLAIQGSDSGWIIILVSVLFACFSSLLEGKWSKPVFFFFVFWTSLSVYSTSRLYELALKKGVTKVYDSFQFWGSTPVFLWISICFSILFLMSICKGTFLRVTKWNLSETQQKKIGIWSYILFFAGIFLSFFCLVLHGFYPDFLPFMDHYEYLAFGPKWGHDRGGNWMLSIKIFQKFGIWRQLFGAGPDCYYYALQNYGRGLFEWGYLFTDSVSSYTNAHNVMLTMLVNYGILGLIFYYGFFLVLIRTFYQHAKENNVLYWLIASLLLCFLHDFVSFQQIISTPYVFLLSAIGMSIVRKNKMGSIKTS